MKPEHLGGLYGAIAGIAIAALAVAPIYFWLNWTPEPEGVLTADLTATPITIVDTNSSVELKDRAYKAVGEYQFDSTGRMWGGPSNTLMDAKAWGYYESNEHLDLQQFRKIRVDDQGRSLCSPDTSMSQYIYPNWDLSVPNSGILLPAHMVNIIVPEGYTYVKIMPWKHD